MSQFKWHVTQQIMIDVFLKNNRGADASGIFDPSSQRITLRRGSILAIDPYRTTAPNIRQNFKTAREWIAKGILKSRKDGRFEVISNATPPLSPSAASVIVTGKSGSGWKSWRLSDKRPLSALRLRGSRRAALSSRGSPPSVQNLPSRGNLPPAPLPSNATFNDLINELVSWIDKDPFERIWRSKKQIRPVPGALAGVGWDFRITQYAYAKSKVINFSTVYSQTLPIIRRISPIVARYKWSQISKVGQIQSRDSKQLESDAEWICNWGGVPQPDYSRTWEVVKSAVSGAPVGSAPMNSGWTKVASFATDGLPCAQTIWDSRVSTAIIWRIDNILRASNLNPRAFPALSDLRVVPGRGGTRPRTLHYHWASGECSWLAHFAGSQIVRRIVDILNNRANGYRPMLQPNGTRKPWDVFGVGLVLFMDGY